MGMVYSPRPAHDYSRGFIRIKYHAPANAPLMNPSQVPMLREAATVAQSTGLRTTVSIVESSMLANNLFYTSSKCH